MRTKIRKASENPSVNTNYRAYRAGLPTNGERSALQPTYLP